METPKHTFPLKGLSIEVSEGAEAEQAYIKYTEDGIVKEFRIDGFKTSKGSQEVMVYYFKYIKDSKNNVYNQDTFQYFRATEQETASYFYNLPAEKLGLKIDQMSINGLLIELFGIICFSPENGMFLPPITATYKVTPATFSGEINPETDALELNKDGKIKIIPVDIIGNPVFKIMGTEIENNSGEFEDLAAGDYSILIGSDAEEMPMLLKINVGVENQ